MRVKAPSPRFVAALLLAWVTVLGAARADTPEKVGVNAAVNSDANGTPPGGTTRRLVIGEDIVHNERVTTDAKGQTEILFVDGSAISVGPNADLTIDEYVYDPQTGAGKMTLTDLQGAMRFIGGKLSKQADAVSVHLGTATIGVRGGVFIANARPGGKSEVIFVFGKALKVWNAHSEQDLYRSGFAVDIDGNGLISAPYPVPPEALVAILGQLDGRAGGHGGATTVPTDATVAASAVPNTVSNNIQASVQQANGSQPQTQPPAPTTAPQQVSTQQIQAANSPPTPPAEQPVVVEIAGMVKVAPTGSALGFTDQTTKGRAPYTGSITYAAGGMQNGVGTGADAAGTVFTLSPLTAGATTDATGVASTSDGPATGTVTTSADGDFFYGNLVVTRTGEQVFIMGGTPVSSSFYAPTSSPQFYAFKIQPDGALAAGGQAQTIPFVPVVYGGALPNAVASPLYMTAPANTQFGSNVTNGPKYLQASLAVNGQGANQTGALVVTTGTVLTASDTHKVVTFGPVRGSIFTSATAPLERIVATSTTVPDANSNSLFGGSTLDGFVLDQNSISVTPNVFVPNLATQQIFQSGSGPVDTSYAFNQPVTAAPLPSGIGATRSALNETGFFGGIMQTSSQPANAIVEYPIFGATGVQTNPTSNTVYAVFTGTDPLTASTSGLNSVTLNFGTPARGGAINGRTAFIDNNTYAALESPAVADVISRQVSGSPLVTTLPLPPSGGSFQPALAMVTTATLGTNGNSWMPAGVTPCTCQYLQWGYWTGGVDSPATTTQGMSGPLTRDFANINTWLAGMPTVTMPTTGTGTYSGAAIGSVFNNGANYLAAGNFNNTYNFGTNTGSISVTNFDGRNFSGTVGGSGNAYAGNLAGTNLSGVAAGMFYGPGAAETGGSFAVHATSGPSYIASGIFAGKLTGPIH